jgi:hypothetical protein
VVTINDLVTYNERQSNIIKNCYSIGDNDKFSEITLLSRWHHNNLEMKSKLCNNPIQKDIYLQQLNLISEYHEYRLNKSLGVKYATI